MAAQQWRHEWVPLTPSAMKQKNHGSAPGPDNKIRTMAKGGDVAAATAAIKAGDNAKAVNLLTRAMNNSTSKQKAAIKAQRAELSRKLIGRR